MLKPDAGYEHYWLNFKDSVLNANRQHDGTELAKISDTIPSITRKLNQLQQAERYDEIRQIIQEFLKQYFLKSLTLRSYYRDIAMTNFDRWLKLYPNQTSIDPLSDPEMNYLYFLHKCVVIDEHTKRIIQQGVREHKQVVVNISVLQQLFDYSIKNRKVAIFNKFLNHYHEWFREELYSQYGIEIPESLKNGNKINKILS